MKKVFFLIIMFSLISSNSNGTYKKLAYDFDMLDKFTLKDNSLLGWLKSLINPDKNN